MLKRPNSSAVPDQKHRDRSARHFRFKGLPPDGETGNYGLLAGKRPPGSVLRGAGENGCVLHPELVFLA